jgi:hypothetical protein
MGRGVRFVQSSVGARLELVEGEAHLYTEGDVVALAERITGFTGGLERADRRS